MENPTWYNDQVHGCCNITVQSCLLIVPWQHVLSCMNNAVDLSWWFQQRCSSLYVRSSSHAWTVCANMAWTNLSTTLFKPRQLNQTSCAFLRVYRKASLVWFWGINWYLNVRLFLEISIFFLVNKYINVFFG